MAFDPLYKLDNDALIMKVTKILMQPQEGDIILLRGRTKLAMLIAAEFHEGLLRLILYPSLLNCGHGGENVRYSCVLFRQNGGCCINIGLSSKRHGFLDNVIYRLLEGAHGRYLPGVVIFRFVILRG